MVLRKKCSRLGITYISRIKVFFFQDNKWTNTQTNTQTWYFIEYDLHSLS